MTLALRVLDDADQEVAHAAAVYELESPNLARRFLSAYRSSVEHAMTFPGGGVGHPRFAPHDVRAFHLDVFPYTVFAAVRAEELVIVAVQHQGQTPGYWADRLAAFEG